MAERLKTCDFDTAEFSTFISEVTPMAVSSGTLFSHCDLMEGGIMHRTSHVTFAQEEFHLYGGDRIGTHQLGRNFLGDSLSISYKLPFGDGYSGWGRERRRT